MGLNVIESSHYPLNERIVGISVFEDTNKVHFIVNSEYGSQRIVIISDDNP
jgi:hypothetical protein